MHNKSIIFVASLLLFFACNSSKERPVLKEPETERIAPLVADNWKVFWKNFTTALNQSEIDKIEAMTRFPLFSNMEENGFSNQQLKAQFSDIFDEKTKTTFSNLTDRGIILVPSNEETAGFMNTPIGIELKTINVMYITDEGTDNQTESSKTFVFGEIDGQYKLLALMVAG